MRNSQNTPGSANGLLHVYDRHFSPEGIQILTQSLGSYYLTDQSGVTKPVQFSPRLNGLRSVLALTV